MTKRIFRSAVLISSCTLFIGLSFILGILYHHFAAQLTKELKQEAHYLSLSVEADGKDSLSRLNQNENRITLIDSDGTVLYDNKSNADTMENHADRKEVKDALKKGYGKDSRMSSTLSEKTVYYALRLKNGQILRISSTQYTIWALVKNLIQPMLYVVILMIILAAVFASRISSKIIKPLNELDLNHPEENVVYDEISPLLRKISKQQGTIQRQLSDARKQQEEFQTITENMQEGLLVIDYHTTLLSFNRSALDMLGVTDATLNQSILTLNRSVPFLKCIETALEGKNHSEILSMNDRSCQLIANPVISDGQVTGAFLLLVDITEKFHLDKLRREFTANVSHELKTPLTSISGFAEIIQDGFVKPENIRTFAHRIFSEAQHLIVMIDDIIKISQLDEHQIPYEKEDVDLYELGKNIFNDCQKLAEKNKVSLYLEGEHCSLPTVRPILEEILSNLCTNAVKYNKLDGTVTLCFEKTDRNVLISVKDTGIGIPDSQKSRIFERFYRIDKSHSKEVNGTGLGLSIVKHGAAFLGAEVFVESQEGVGSCFTLRFPVNPESSLKA